MTQTTLIVIGLLSATTQVAAANENNRQGRPPSMWGDAYALAKQQGNGLSLPKLAPTLAALTARGFIESGKAHPLYRHLAFDARGNGHGHKLMGQRLLKRGPGGTLREVALLDPRAGICVASNLNTPVHFSGTATRVSSWGRREKPTSCAVTVEPQNLSWIGIGGQLQLTAKVVRPKTSEGALWGDTVAETMTFTPASADLTSWKTARRTVAGGVPTTQHGLGRFELTMDAPTSIGGVEHLMQLGRLTGFNVAPQTAPRGAPHYWGTADIQTK